MGKRRYDEQRRISKRSLYLAYVSTVQLSFKAQTLLGEFVISPEFFEVGREMLS